MLEPDPKPDAGIAHGDAPRQDLRMMDRPLGEIDARDPAVAEAAEIADRVGANA